MTRQIKHIRRSKRGTPFFAGKKIGSIAPVQPKKIALVNYISRQDDDPTEGQEIGLYPDNDAGFLSACLELLGQLGYSISKERD
jgi:hypothetical protein